MNKILALIARLSGGAVVLEKIVKYRTHLIKLALVLSIIGAWAGWASGVISQIAMCNNMSCIVEVVRSIPDDVKSLLEKK